MEEWRKELRKKIYEKYVNKEEPVVEATQPRSFFERSKEMGKSLPWKKSLMEKSSSLPGKFQWGIKANDPSEVKEESKFMKEIRENKIKEKSLELVEETKPKSKYKVL